MDRMIGTLQGWTSMGFVTPDLWGSFGPLYQGPRPVLAGDNPEGFDLIQPGLSRSELRKAGL